jgi:site-specific DNA recombinase
MTREQHCGRAVYARLSETYDAAESVPTQLANAERHAARRGWQVVARLKDDGYSAFKEIRRDDFINLISAIERDEVDVVIVRDIDRLTRNLADWDRFEKAAIEHHVKPVRLGRRGPGPVHPGRGLLRGMETLRAKRESAVRSVRVREAHDRIARQGKIPGGGPRWFGWTRVYANPEASPRQRVILRLDIDEVEAAALRDAAERVLRGETIYSIVCEWEQRGIRPVVSGRWSYATLASILVSPRLAGLREWQGKKYPAQWPAIIDADTHERLVLRADLADQGSFFRGQRAARRSPRLAPVGTHLLPFRPGRGLVSRGHHLPETTRRSDITSVPLLANPAGDATIRTGQEAGQYHGVMKSLRFALTMAHPG